MKFIDLFCGIGGFRQGFESEGYDCVFSSEIDPTAASIYERNYKEIPYGDITKINKKDIPDHDVLLGGFPCQPFSIAGHKMGFEDTRGTLFFEILETLSIKNPNYFVLENVKHLKHHDGGRTLKVILNSLNDLEYKVNWSLLNANDFGVPQNRERILIVGNKKEKFDFNLLEKKPKPKLKDFLNDNENHTYLDSTEYTLLNETKVQKSGLIFAGYLNKNIRKKGVRPDTLHLSRVHKQCNRIYSYEGVHPTLNAQESTGRYYILTDKGVRKLSLNECYKIMGFNEDFKKEEFPKTQLYKAIGNSICIPMVKEIARVLRTQY